MQQKPKDTQAHSMSNDLWGKALLEFFEGTGDGLIETETTHSEPEPFSMAYLFRNLEQLPKVEQVALQLAQGSILDIGCGAGAHLQILQNLQKEAWGIDTSAASIKVCQERGFHNTDCRSFATEKRTFDTLLLLMNGSGILAPITRLVGTLKQLGTLLNPGGCILLDSTDIAYLFPNKIPERKRKMNNNYYGEVSFTVRYKNKKQTMPWLYLDAKTAKQAFEEAGFEVVFPCVDGDSYLLKATIKEPAL